MRRNIRVIAVLAHLMDKNGVLGEETVARIEAAFEQYECSKFDYIITSGWDYRDDSNLMIGAVVAECLVDRYGVDVNHIIVDINSRDTVGDAFFIRRRLCDFIVSEMLVVTSDYHVERTGLIFKKFFSPATKIKVIGAKTNVVNRESIESHENSSIDVFSRTFQGVDFSSDNEVVNTLTTKHPFYNGSIYRKPLADFSI